MPKAKKQNSSRKAFKQTAAYKKPREVGAGEQVGSAYRKKLQAQQAAARAGTSSYSI
jgi:hypothetical protein